MGSNASRSPTTGAARTELRGVRPAICLLLVGLLADFFPRAEVYANIECGLSLVAAFGAVVCVGHLAAPLSRRLGDLMFACSTLAGSANGDPARGEGIAGEGVAWPLLVALLFGPFCVLIAGLGGWV